MTDTLVACALRSAIEVVEELHTLASTKSGLHACRREIANQI